MPKCKPSLLPNLFSHIIIYAMVKSGKIEKTPSRDLIAQTVPTPRSLRPAKDGPLDGVRVILAPLCGITDAVFRRICFDRGADLAATEMISSDGLVLNSPDIRAIRHLDMSDGPLSLQIFGSNPETMGQAAAILSDLEPRTIDINFGCPVRKIVNKHGGSAVLKDLGLLEKICRKVVERSRVPVSVKIRSGWEQSTVENTQDIARVIEDAGVSMITVHARTKVQGFTGRADWLLIKAVKEAVRIPVVGNGDVTDSQSYLRMREVTGCDAVMIGRSAIGNPWVFEGIDAASNGLDYIPPLPRERVEGLLRHARLAVQYYGEPAGLIATRRIMAAYLKHLPNARGIRSKIMGCTQLLALEEILGAAAPLRVSEGISC